LTQYVGIWSEGGLIPYDVIDQIAREESGFGQHAKDFGLPGSRRVTDEIARSWSDTQDYWHIFQRRSTGLEETETGTTLTRKWATDLLNESLGYDLTYQPSGAVIGGKNYPISHRAGVGEESPPVDIEGFRIDLDHRPQARRLSPQALVQEYLNNSDGQLWGIVTNGLLLRLLRDTSRTSRPTYLEFDLQSILDGNRFNEFALFYRVCHRSRLPRTAEDSTSCWLEKYFQLSIEQGGRVREKLGEGVEDALKSFGTGFLRHPKNEKLRERIRSGVLAASDFHRQLLRMVYRLLFLMVAEERRMIVPETPDSERRQRLYDAYYSVGRLRDLVETTIEPSTFGDLWIGLQQAFAFFEGGADPNPLGIPPLNGDLFSIAAVKDLQGTHLYNDDLLTAMKHISLFEDRRILQRVNYGALDVEELGSVYESLLDYQPVVTEQPDGMAFELRTGSERKSTGSYYTRPELVRELVESALVPAMEDRLVSARDSESGKESAKQQQAILSMSVCDPACGSGHFLLAAARCLGRELAKIRTGEEEPTPKEFHLAVRDVIAHCIYGVDLNPLAVDLCKLALWLEGHWAGKPLSFLDHHVKCGNSLIGVLEPKVLEDGIPDEAFTPVTGDNKEVAKAYKKRNKEERKGQYTLTFETTEHAHQFAATTHGLDDIAEETPADVKLKQKLYEEWRNRPDWWHDWTASNIWTAAFFVPLTKFEDPTVPTHDRFLRFAEKRDSQPQMARAANALAQELRFFHWRLEFPRVFERGGFDVVLGNPPWERIKLQEEEHWIDEPYIANAKNKAERARRIHEYRTSNEPKKVMRVARFDAAKHISEAEGRFIRGSNHFPLTAVGDINTYAVFAELGRSLLRADSRVGMLLPTGIATDDTTKMFFGSQVQSDSIVSLFGFENEGSIFPAVHHTFKFCALTLSSSSRKDSPQFAFLCRQVNDIHDARRRFTLTRDDFNLLNPNTRNCPIFRTVTDANLTKKLYRAGSVLINETLARNEWNIKFLTMFHMANDSGSFRSDATEADLVPLYEAKMMHQFDHRYATYAGATQANLNAGILPQTSDGEKQDPAFCVKPRYWVERSLVEERLDGWKHNWLIGFRDVTSAIVERTAIFCVLPRVGVGHKVPLILLPGMDAALRAALLLANFNSLVFDFATRQKIGWNSLSYFILKQLPVIDRATYAEVDTESVVSRVVRLTYTSSGLRDFALECRADEEPIPFDSEKRREIRAELDAYYAHLYGLTRDELRYILDPKDVFGQDFPSETFRVLKEREIKEYGEYRTQRLVLEAFDKLADSPRFRDEMPKRVSAIKVPEPHSSSMTATGR
jgi:hypothetical protein